MAHAAVLGSWLSSKNWWTPINWPSPSAIIQAEPPNGTRSSIASLARLASTGPANHSRITQPLSVWLGPHEPKRAWSSEWLAGPVLANLAKEAMLDRVPFGGSAWIMADGDGQLIGVHQFLLESQLPSTAACAIAAAAVG